MSTLIHHLQPSRLTALPPSLYRTTETECFRSADFIHVNFTLLAQWGIDPADVVNEETLALLSGQHRLDFAPIATVYAGHQFGIYTSQLGDGRVHILGDLEAEDRRPWEIQLKGAGATPFARGNDGRLSLAEAISEYLASEAMAALGIATTRSLAILDHHQPHPLVENGAAQCILVRCAPSHLRFGHIEYWHNQGDAGMLRSLVEHVIEQHYPHLLELPEGERVLTLLYAITRTTAELVAQWQAMGFTHGVMNTDNMSLLGLTMDYGVFGFMPQFEPEFCPNESDDQERYAFHQQVDVGRWNCLALAEALQSLLPQGKIPSGLLRHYRQHYQLRYRQLMSQRLGLRYQSGDEALIEDLLKLLAENRLDYARFMRQLCHYESGDQNSFMLDKQDWYVVIQHWLSRYLSRAAQEFSTAEERRAQMLSHNPKYQLRTELLQEAIHYAEVDRDTGPLEELLSVLQSPFDEHAGFEHLA